MEPAAARRRPTDVVAGARRAPVSLVEVAASGTAARGGRRRPWSSFVVSWAALRRARRRLDFCEAALFCVLCSSTASSSAVCAAFDENRAVAGV